VLSFPDRDEEYLGDIFISIDKVYEQAKQYNHSVEREFAFLLTHGILHLLGYDHENTNDEKKMIAKQEEILKKYRRV
jgi:probable rRNA maturation factor